MKLLQYSMVILALLAFYACSDDDPDIPETSSAINLKTSATWLRSETPVGVLLLGKDAAAENQMNKKYEAERDEDTFYLKPTDVTNAILLPADGSTYSVFAYYPYSDQLDKVKQTLPIDLTNQGEWYEMGFKTSTGVFVSAPVDTAVWVDLKDCLSSIRVSVRTLKGDVTEVVKLTKDNISVSNVALSGSYSFKDNKFVDKNISEKYSFSLFDDEGAAKGVFLPGDEAIAITYKDENGKIFTLTQIDGIGIDEKKDIHLVAGYRLYIIMTVKAGQMEAVVSGE
ncbi:fimbrillin family protein [uncultured Parabacteroides sp.]|uniref:fimbrillin family protein n=1 Tax=uncultured Parabacteroides sp. TaxID=512312 RepID=UPI0026264EAA|nr:fimbrillin family protein [uncultured Parabacteroides sp.]